jgi:hypothetical protein
MGVFVLIILLAPLIFGALALYLAGLTALLILCAACNLMIWLIGQWEAKHKLAGGKPGLYSKRRESQIMARGQLPPRVRAHAPARVSTRVPAQAQVRAHVPVPAQAPARSPAQPTSDIWPKWSASHRR